MSRRIALVFSVVALLTAPSPGVLHAAAPAGALARIRNAGTITLGYREDARPFSYVDADGNPAGYSVALCKQVVEAIRHDLNMSVLSTKWIPLRAEDRSAAFDGGRIDLMCGADTVTLERRARMDFSIPIFPGGIAALVRSDAPARLQEVLAGGGQPFHPVWRANAVETLQARDFSVVAGTTAQTWLAQRMRVLDVIAGVAPVHSYGEGMQRVVDRQSDVFFGERAVLLDAAKRHDGGRNLRVIDRLFTYEPVALALPRGDDDFRLAVDRALSRVYQSPAFSPIYKAAFGEPDTETLNFFRWNALPE